MISTAQELEVINLIENGESVKNIVIKTGLKSNSIYYIAKSYGIEININQNKSPIRAFKILKALIDDYPRLTLTEIAKSFGISYQRVQQIKNEAEEAGLLDKKSWPLNNLKDSLGSNFQARELARAILFNWKMYDDQNESEVSAAIRVMRQPLISDDPIEIEEDEESNSQLGLSQILKNNRNVK